MKRKLDKAVSMSGAKLVAMVRPGVATSIQLAFLKRNGMRLSGTPNYVSSKVWFDGTDYSLIELGEGCTISSFVRVLTHDWAPHTVLRGMGSEHESPIGRIEGVVVGSYSFVGTGSVIMPGAQIGRCCIIGAGTVVRGRVPDYSIVVGSPGSIVGDVRDYLQKNYAEAAAGCADPSLSSRAEPARASRAPATVTDSTTT